MDHDELMDAAHFHLEHTLGIHPAHWQQAVAVAMGEAIAAARLRDQRARALAACAYWN